MAPSPRSRSQARRDAASPAQPAPSSRRDAALGANDKRRSASSARISPEDKAQQSRRPSSRQATPEKGRSARREAAPEKGRSARREATSGKGQQSARKSSRTSAKSSVAEGRSGRASSRRKAPSTLKKIITWSIIGLVILAAIGIAMTPGILRSMKASELAQAAAPDVDRVASEYLTRIDYQSAYIDSFIGAYPDAPLSTGLRLIELAHHQSEGRVARFQPLMAQAARGDLSTQERTAIVSLATTIYDGDQHRESFVPRQLAAWANPDGSVDQDSRALALASLDLLILVRHKSDLRVDEVVADLAGNPTGDSRLVEAAIAALAKITEPGNVGYAMNLLIGPNADAASRNADLLEAIYRNVRAAHIPSILRLWESPIDAVAALGFRAIGGPGVVLGENDAAQREELGQRVSALLTAELLSQSPVRFGGLLDAVLNLRLSGTRSQLLTLAPQMNDELADKAAAALASFVRDGGEEQKTVNEDTLSQVTAAINDEGQRQVGLATLTKLRTGNGIIALRDALEAAIAHGDHPLAMPAIHHVVKDLYKRPDAIERNASDVARWQQYIAQDRPRFTFFQEAVAWHRDNQHLVRVSDRDTIPANRARAEEVQPELQRWIEDPNMDIPLGLTKKQVEDFHHTVNTFKRNLIHSDVR